MFTQNLTPNKDLRLTMAQLLIVAAVSPVLLFPRGVLPWVGLGLIILSWVLRGYVTGAWLIRTPLDHPILLLFLATLASLYPSVDLTLSAPKLYGILLGLFAYYAVVRSVCSQRLFWLGIGVLVASMVAISLLGLVGSEWNVAKYPALLPLLSSIPRLIRGVQTSVGPAAGFHPNELGGSLAFLLPLPLALVLHARPSLPYRVLLAAVILLGLGVLALSSSRSSFLALAVSILVLLVWRWRHVGLVLVAVSVATSVVAFMLNPQGIVDFLLKVDVATVAGGGGNLVSRQEIWERATYMIQDFPFTGIGLNTFPVILNTLYPSFLAGDARIPHAHNIYLQTAIDLGLGGLLAFLGLWACTVYAGWQAYRQAVVFQSSQSSPWGESSAGVAMQWAIVGMLLGLLSYLVFGLTDAITLGAKPTVLLWLMMGLLVAAKNLCEAPKNGGVVPVENTIRDTGQSSAPTVETAGSFRPLRPFQGRASLRHAVRFTGYAYWTIAYLLVGLGSLIVVLGILGWTP